MLEDKIQQRLASRQLAGLMRKREVLAPLQGLRFQINGKEYVNFSSNDYLGLAGKEQSVNSFAGATASPLVVGRHSLHRQLEELLLDWQQAPVGYDCMLFSSGFAANTGVLQAFFNEKDVDARLIQDRLNHASLMDAGKHVQSLGHVKQLRFAHNDMCKLNNLLSNKVPSGSSALVVTEGVFSMDGDSPDLIALNRAAKLHDVCWMLDDAHGVGISGEAGAGSLSEHGLGIEDCDVLVITFGKAIGAQGAAVIAKQSIIDYLVNFSREYVYSTHLSPIQTQAAINNIICARNDDWRRDKLVKNIEKFRVGLENTSFRLLESQSPIQPIIIGDEDATVTLSKALRCDGVWATPMRYPTVGKGQARLRVTICADHSESQIEYLVKKLIELDE